MIKFLLPVMIVASFACQTVTGLAADSGSATAYTALRSMGKSLGSDAITRVVEVTGHGGTPQPGTWRIVIADGSRGTREVKVSGARVVSQKVSSQATSLKPIRLEDLNLDSSGAFDAANTEARKSRVPFASLDYALRVNDATGKPVWNLELFNDANSRVGTVRLAAHDGKLLSVSGLNSTGQPSSVRPLVSADHDSVQPTRVVPSRNTTTTTTTTYRTTRPEPTPSREYEEARSSEGGFFSRAGRTLDHTSDAVGDTMSRTGETVGRTMRRTGAKLQRFFTGHDDQD